MTARRINRAYLGAELLTNQADAQREAGHPDDAVKSFRKAEDILAATANPTADQLYDLACCQARLAGVASLAGSGLSVDEARAAADKALATLRRAVDAGFRDAANMSKDTDLESLHNRDDFQALVREVEEKAKAKK